MALLLITHDLGIVRHMAQRVCVMQGARIVEAGPTEQVFKSPQHAYTQQLLAAEPKRRARVGVLQFGLLRSKTIKQTSTSGAH
jgi:microcin C transport system ATP-binding protein